MTETKFTPGPWVVGPFDMIWPASDVELRDGKWREKVAEPRIIASASKGNLLPHEDKANAHLIAAAPDLYEASEPFDDLATLRVVHSPEWRDSDTITVIVSIGALRDIKAARAKARGEANPSGGDRHGE